MNTTIIGWTGSILFSVCGAPQAIKTWKDGHAKGLDLYFLLLWTGGEVFTLTAVLLENASAYLVCNYLINLVWLLVMWRYKLYPKDRS
jgi:uncharacterized protein with PQ loop repeat